MGRTKEQKKKIIGGWAAAGGWFLALSVLSSLPGGLAEHLLGGTVAAVETVLGTMMRDISQDTLRLLDMWIPYVLQVLAFMVAGLLCGNALRLMGLRMAARVGLGTALVSLFAVLDELHQLVTPGRLPRVADWALDVAAAAFVLGGIWLYDWMRRTFPRLVNRETVSYVVFGVLTTLVNIVAFLMCSTLLPIPPALSTLVNNAIAWVIAVLFAYVVNKLFVFRSKTAGWRAAWREFALFIAARLLSFGVDELGMWLMIDVSHINRGVSKIAMNVVVMVMNYFFSKWFIFNKGARSSGPEGCPSAEPGGRE